MMKEVCAQCLQKHVDPATGKETIIFSCFNQDQELDRVDFPNLAARLRQNTVQEKLANLWLDHLLRRARAQLDATCQPSPRSEFISCTDRSMSSVGSSTSSTDSRAVGVRDDHAVASGGAVVADFVAELLAVAIEKPDHPLDNNIPSNRALVRGQLSQRRSCSLADVRVR